MKRRMSFNTANPSFEEIEYRFQNAHGKYLWIASRILEVKRDERGAVDHVVGAFIDITSRKTEELRVQSERDQLDGLIANAPFGLFKYDEKYIYANEAFLRLRGLTLEALLQRQPAIDKQHSSYETIGPNGEKVRDLPIEYNFA